MSFLQTIANQKGSKRARDNRIPVLWTRKINNRVIVKACTSDNIKSIIIHISVNTNKVKDANNKTRNEVPSVTDNSVINAPRYFKLCEFGKTFLNKIDGTCELLCMETPKEKYEM